MNTVERIFELMKQRGVTANTVAKTLGFGNSQFTSWKTGVAKPSAEALTKLADYFDVSVDFLLCRTDSPKAELQIPPELEKVRAAFYEGEQGEFTQQDIDDVADFVRFIKERRKKDAGRKKD